MSDGIDVVQYFDSICGPETAIPVAAIQVSPPRELALSQGDDGG